MISILRFWDNLRMIRFQLELFVSVSINSRHLWSQFLFLRLKVTAFELFWAELRWWFWLISKVLDCFDFIIFTLLNINIYRNTLRWLYYQFNSDYTSLLFFHFFLLFFCCFFYFTLELSFFFIFFILAIVVEYLSFD